MFYSAEWPTYFPLVVNTICPAVVPSRHSTPTTRRSYSAPIAVGPMLRTTCTQHRGTSASRQVSFVTSATFATTRIDRARAVRHRIRSDTIRSSTTAFATETPKWLHLHCGHEDCSRHNGMHKTRACPRVAGQEAHTTSTPVFSGMHVQIRWSTEAGTGVAVRLVDTICGPVA